MSVWIVSKKHIDYIVTALKNAGLADDPDKAGRLLWRENLRSVAYRYPQDKSGSRPGPAGFRDRDVKRYTWEQTELLSGGALAKTLGCYRCQSSEHPGWDTSKAHRLVNKLFDRFDPGRNPPYDDSVPWGW